MKRIAGLCGVDVSNVGEALKRLKEHGYVDWTSRPGNGKSRCSNLYRINYDLVPRLHDHPCPEREEETAIEEVEAYVRESIPDDVVGGSNIIQAVVDRLVEMVPGANRGPKLYRWLREAQRGEGDSSIDEVIKEEMDLHPVESKE